MAEHLFDNVWQVGGGELSHPDDSTVIFLKGDRPEDDLLIETGSIQGHQAIRDNISECGGDIDKIQKVIASHCHDDHISGAYLLPDAIVQIHPNDRKAIITGDNNLRASFLYDESSPPFIPKERIETIEHGYETKVGDTNISVIHVAPSHTPGSIVVKLAAPSMTVGYGGDIFWGGYSERIGSSKEGWNETLDYLASNEKFDALILGHSDKKLITNAMAHIALLQADFWQDVRPSHNGLYTNPWRDRNKAKSAA